MRVEPGLIAGLHPHFFNWYNFYPQAVSKYLMRLFGSLNHFFISGWLMLPAANLGLDIAGKAVKISFNSGIFSQRSISITIRFIHPVTSQKCFKLLYPRFLRGEQALGQILGRTTAMIVVKML